MEGFFSISSSGPSRSHITRYWFKDRAERIFFCLWKDPSSCSSCSPFLLYGDPSSSPSPDFPFSKLLKDQMTTAGACRRTSFTFRSRRAWCCAKSGRGRTGTGLSYRRSPWTPVNPGWSTPTSTPSAASPRD